MFAGVLFALLTLAMAASASDRQGGGDPQLPPFMHTDKETYLALRAEQIALLRGWEPGKPFTSTPRIKALNLMDHQIRSAAKSPRLDGTTPTAFNGRAWTAIGPAPIPNGQTSPTNPVSGRVTAIAIHPTNPSLVYVGTAQGGVYRTSDGGTTWTPIFDGALSLAIGALALAPSNPGVLYVGTGEANGSVDSYAGVGLYRVDNADTTPSLVGPINPIRTYVDPSSVTHNVPVFNGRSISKIVVHPTQPGTVFVGTAGASIGIDGDAPFGGTIDPLSLRGLWRSTNADGALGSITFSRIKVSTSAGGYDTPNTGNRNINDIVLDPADSTGNTVIVWQNGTAAAGDGGVWRSTNAMAADPTAISFTQTFATTATSTANGRAAFAYYNQGSNPTVIYEASGEPSSGTGCADATKLGALRRSTDGGQTWSGKLAGGGGFCGDSCFYNIGLAVVAGTSNATDRIHIGGDTNISACQRLHARSLDGGVTFTNFDGGLHADTHVIAVAPSDATIVFHGNDGGIWKSTNSGQTWTSLNNSGFNATQFQSIALHPSDANFTIGGTQDNGTNMYRPAATWNRIDYGDGGFSAIDQNAADNTNVTMYHTYSNQTDDTIGFARVDSVAGAFDGNWNFFGAHSPTSACVPANGINCADSVLFYPPLVLGPGNPNTVYFGTDRLYRSTDKGVHNTVVGQAPFSAGIPISAVGISPQDDNVRIVGLSNGGLFYTATGANFLPVLDPVGGGSVIPDKYVTRVVIDPGDKTTAYIALAGYMGGTTSALSHVWKVTNLDTSPVLTAINNGLPDVPVNAFVVDPTNSSNLFAGTDIGVYASTDGGATWQVLGAGLPRVAVFDMAFQRSSRMLRIATHGRGMWQLSLNVRRAIFDLDGDGRSDVLWRHASGQVYAWEMNGLAIGSSGALLTVADANWKIVGVGDFNGDGKADILWRHAVTGQTYVWLMNGLSIASSGAPPTVPDLNWQVQGTGDYDGDGKADVLWRHAGTGQIFVWLMNGLSIASSGSPSTVADLNWQVQGTGDFNGDGKADILWRHALTGQTYVYLMNGLSVAASGSPGTVADLAWQVAGVGDYNGDGKADIVWRRSDGQNYLWLMNGLAQASSGPLPPVPDTNWKIQGTGDYNGDGKADILWRHAGTGQTYMYLMNGLSVVSSGLPSTVPDLNWQVQNPK
jgi:hypothetical protein